MRAGALPTRSSPAAMVEDRKRGQTVASLPEGANEDAGDLLSHHRKMLLEESAIAQEVAQARGYRTVRKKGANHRSHKTSRGFVLSYVGPHVCGDHDDLHRTVHARRVRSVPKAVAGPAPPPIRGFRSAVARCSQTPTTLPTEAS